MKLRRNFFLVVIATLLFAAVQTGVYSQTTSSNPDAILGTPPYTSFGGINENINFSTGNLSVTVPLLRLPGRAGHDLNLALILDSKKWEMVRTTYPGGEVWYWDGGSPSWRLSPVPSLSSQTNVLVQYIYVQGALSELRCKTNFVVTLGDGSKHWFPNRNDCYSVGNGSAPAPSYNVTVGDSDNATYLRLDTTNTADIVLYFKNGKRVHFQSGSVTKEIDRNGNTITYSPYTQPGTITDTLGRTVTVNWVNGWELGAITYKDSSGTNQQITFSYSDLTIAPTFQLPSVANVPPPQTKRYLTGITLPNGLSYTFEYNTYGELTEITYPTGGYTRYEHDRFVHAWHQWASTAPGAGFYLYSAPADFRQLVSRRVCPRADGACSPAEEQVTTFQPTVDGAKLFNQYMDVTDPDGNRTRFEFSLQTTSNAVRFFAPREIRRTVYQGQNTPLRAVVTDYSDLSSAGTTQQWSLPVRMTTTLSDTNEVSKTEFTYDSYTAIVSDTDPVLQGPVSRTRPINNVVEKREFAFGIGSPGPLERRTGSSWVKTNPVNGQNYHTTSVHILDLLASNSVYDAVGTLKGQTLFEYDNYTEGLAQTGTVQHETAFSTSYTTRGNLTATRRWRNTDGSLIITRHQYDDAGNIRKTTDPMGHVTLFSYDDSWAQTSCSPTGGLAKAYLTSVTNALSQTNSTTYNSCSGTPAVSIDANGLQTSFAYDALGRPVTVNLPDGGQTTNAYNDVVMPRSVTTTTKLSASTNLIAESILDGLGREVLSVLESDPDPRGFSRTATEYDANGRVKRKYNATRCNPATINCGEPAWGYVEFVYDALGRKSVIKPPDGTITPQSNVAVRAFVGSSVTATDPVGKQRRAYVDALGRLVRVEEPSPTPPTPGSGSATTSGSEQSVGGTGPTPGTGSVNITGTEQSAYVEVETWGCVLWYEGQCWEEGWVYEWQWVYDSGSVGVTINGQTKYVFYGQGSTGNSIASALRNAINGDANYPVTASVSGTVLNLTSKATGSSSNYSLSAYSYSDDPANFDPPSFVPVPSGSTLTGGGSGSGATYDTGNVWVTVNGQTKNVTYGQSSTSATVASALASAINADGSYPVTASLAGTALTLTARAAGASTNYSLSGGSSTDLPGTFSQPSFSIAVSGSSLTGGTDGGTGSLTNPAITLYTYDALDNLTCVVQKGTDTTPFTTCDAAPATWRPRKYTYNSLSQLTQAVNPESGSICYGAVVGGVCQHNGHDDDGNIIIKTDARGITTCFGDWTGSSCNGTTGYDGLNRLLKKTYSNADPPVAYFYDQTSYGGLSIANGKGKRTGMSDGSGITAWSYEMIQSVGWKTVEQRTIGGVTKTISYQKNLGGVLAQLTYPSGRVVNYTTSSAGQIVAVTDPGLGLDYATDVVYSAHGEIEKLVNGGYLATTLFFNNRLQPCRIHIRSSGLAPANCSDFSQIANVMDLWYDFGFGVADNGNVKQIANKRDPSRTLNFSYDELNRIERASTQGVSGPYCWGLNHSYDAWANLLTIQQLNDTHTGCWSTTLSHTVNTKNQISGLPYDAAGNLSSDASYSYSWDAESRLKTIAGVTYTYDGDGKRVRKSNGTLYWYGTGDDPLAESDLSGNVSDEYIFLNGRRVARRNAGGTVYYYFSDHLKSARSIVQGGQASPCYEADYTPFGAEVVIVNSCPQSFKFTGKIRDPETSLDYMLARYYSWRQGRFASPDEFAGGPTDALSSNDPQPPGPLPYADITNPQSLNKYTYALNSPVRYVDPNGHTVWDALDVAAWGLSLNDFVSEPSWSNFGWLLADTVSLAPVVPSIGLLRHGSKLGKLFHFANAFEKAAAADVAARGYAILKVGDKIRDFLGMRRGEKVADIISMSDSGRFVITEAKGGSVGSAVEQLASTAEAIAKRFPQAQAPIAEIAVDKLKVGMDGVIGGGGQFRASGNRLQMLNLATGRWQNVVIKFGNRVIPVFVRIITTTTR